MYPMTRKREEKIKNVIMLIVGSLLAMLLLFSWNVFMYDDMHFDANSFWRWTMRG